MYDYLKALFDDNGNPVALTFDQLVEKLGSASDIKLANLTGGEYVSKAKHEADLAKVKTERDGLRNQLTTANETIQSYKDMDIDGIKQSAANWEKKYNDDTAALTKKLEDQETAHCTDMFMSGYKFTSEAARAGIRALFEAQKFQRGDDGKFIGAKEWMDQQIASEGNKGAFVIADDAKDQGQQGNPKFAPDTPPRQPQKHRTLTEIMKDHNANPTAPINFD